MAVVKIRKNEPGYPFPTKDDVGSNMDADTIHENTPSAKTKVLNKVLPEVKAKAEPKAEPKAEQKAEPKAEPEIEGESK